MDSDLPKIHLVSFADGRFKGRANNFLVESEKMGIFNSVKVFSFDDLDQCYQDSHKDFVYKNPKGFGYWIWKPQVVIQKLEKIEDNELLVYMDVGFELNHSGRDRFIEYAHLAINHDSKLLSFSNTHTEYRWSKMDLVNKLGLNANSSLFLTTQLAAGFFILQKNDKNCQLINQWAELAVADSYHYSDDSESIISNHPEFIEHRHDASIFSLLRKLSGTEITHYEVQNYPQFNKLKAILPAWASRKSIPNRLD